MYRGGVYRVGWEGSTRYTHPPDPILVLPGPNQCRPCVPAPTPGTPGPLGPPHTWSSPHSEYPPQDQYGRDSAVYILKLVIIPECRPYFVMRPAIVPVSKKSREVTTWDFQEIPYGQPSLTRNKWSRLCPNHGFIVKTAKCHRNVHIMGTRGGRLQWPYA